MNEIKTFDELLKYTQKEKIEIYEVCQIFESQELNISIKEIRKKVKATLEVMEESINNGIHSTKLSSSKMTGNDCKKLENYFSQKKSCLNISQQKALLYALATAEENARMGKIAACPTAGACGIVPAIIFAYSQDTETQINALITAGQIGKIISNKVALAGAIMGCQGECGSAAAMASGALVFIQKGTNEEIITAATLTLKNILGLVCDPVAGLVEVPCVKRNAFMANIAITGAELSLSGIKSVIPPDEVIDAMYQIGTFISPQLKESSEAGLAATKTGLKIAQKLHK